MFDCCSVGDGEARRRPALSRFLLMVLPLAGLMLSAGALPGVSSVHAQELPPPRTLRLPASAFPHGASVKSGPADNARADAVSLLHSASFAALGRTNGYVQTARWAVGKKRAAVTMQYSASIFNSVVQASSAATDALATLWELGRPAAVPRLVTLGFLVGEHGGKVEAFAVLEQGPVELELSVRYPESLDSRSRSATLRLLGTDASRASRLARPFIPSTPPVASPDEVPPVAVAPWGTGPVVKSPSLMVVGAPGTAWDLQAGPGLFRTNPPALRSRATVTLPATPAVSLFVRSAIGADGSTVQDSASLFANNQAATSAFGHTAAVLASETWLRPVDVQPSLTTLKHLATADAVQAWESRGETVVVLRRDNVILSLAASEDAPAALLALADTLDSTVPTPLHAQGTSIVNAAGDPVHLAGVNWYGTEEQDFVVGGLDFRSYLDILQSIKQLGYNSIRLPISNQVIEQNPVVTAHLSANPELSGLHALDILDRIINGAGALGLGVILDDHRSDAGWSAQETGLWYTPDYPDAAFVHDWATLAQRYAVNDVVIGADLRNEPHGAATWGDGNPATDWRAAAERAGDAALAQNPHLLIIVEGVQFFGSAPSYWWGGNLMGVATAPVELQFADGSGAHSQLVYSAHDYGKDNCGAGCTWFNSTTSYVSLSALWDQYWGYIAADPSKAYAAPVFLGEFGTCNYQQGCVADSGAGTQGQWFSSLVRYVAERHLGWCYWSANGTQSTAPMRNYGDVDWYGLLGKNWLVPGPWIQTALQPIQTDSASTAP